MAKLHLYSKIIKDFDKGLLIERLNLVLNGKLNLLGRLACR